MSNLIKIGNHFVGPSEPVYFIADIAANHDGDLEKAKDLIYSCAESGARAAKFQNFFAKSIVSDKGFRQMGGKLSHQEDWDKSIYEIYDDASLPVTWTEVLKETCADAGIDYFTAPYSLELVELLRPYVSAWKMGSGDITWHEEIEVMARSGLPFIMATGASCMEEVSAAVNVALKHTDQLILMQCNTNYTARLDEPRDVTLERFRNINLKVLESYAKVFPGLSLGLSDHTHGHSTVLGAVGLYGARSVEKHYTLDNNLVGPDHPFSMNPESWRLMVEKTAELDELLSRGMTWEEKYRLVETLCDDPEGLALSIGDGKKKIEDNEKDTVVLQRRALRATRDLKAGMKIGEGDIFPLRPCPEDGLPPYDLDKCVGKILLSDLEEGEHITLGNLG
ncbi:N-acetylneuraminate synthase family protein [Emcibacter sp.]|uniref:N-acetylneuraminate synthase family protein n=1 Tax=Emcibacter sp. TaxID=1979954 RepID=UPI002AA8BB20|nr:N-acetylneuraminate synthase family protein [Emcibacter sp.]